MSGFVSLFTGPRGKAAIFVAVVLMLLCFILYEVSDRQDSVTMVGAPESVEQPLEPGIADPVNAVGIEPQDNVEEKSVNDVIDGSVMAKRMRSEAQLLLDAEAGNLIEDYVDLRKALTDPPKVIVAGSRIAENEAAVLAQEATILVVPLLGVLVTGGVENLSEAEQVGWDPLWQDGKSVLANTLNFARTDSKSNHLVKVRADTLTILLVSPGTDELPEQYNGRFSQDRLREFREITAPIVIISIRATGENGITSNFDFVFSTDQSGDNLGFKHFSRTEKTGQSSTQVLSQVQ